MGSFGTWALLLLFNLTLKAHALVGHYLDETSFPEQVCSILIPNRFDPGGKPIQCSGTIVGTRQLVTAGHCTHKVAEDKVEVRCPGGIKRTVTSHITHEMYDKHRGHKGFDIGLITVDENFGIPPLSVAKTRKQVRQLLGEPRGENCSYFGYGIDEKNQMGSPHGVKAGEIEITEEKILLQKAGPLRSGDSGGPLLCKDQKGQWVLTGTMIKGYDESPDGSGPIDSYTESLEVTGDWISTQVTAPDNSNLGTCPEKWRGLGGVMKVIENLSRHVSRILKKQSISPTTPAKSSLRTPSSSLNHHAPFVRS